jgi:hypothetical protein
VSHLALLPGFATLASRVLDNPSRTMKSVVFMLSLLAVGFAHAQDQDPNLSAATKAYDAHRLDITEPTFALSKVNALIKKIKADKDGNEAISAKAWSAMPANEKFTYTMIHGEDASQNCDAMMALKGEEHMIFSYPPDMFGGEEVWSDRQTKFLHSHRGTVVTLLRSTIRSRGKAGVNINQAIIELKAKELIPDILSVYDQGHKDHDILSTCMVLMKNSGYRPFMKSPIYNTLYGKNASYQSEVMATTSNRNLIERLARSYSRSK